MMRLPVELMGLGPPISEPHGLEGWYRWKCGCSGSNPVVLWKPGMHTAKCLGCGRKIPVKAAEFRPDHLPRWFGWEGPATKRGVVPFLPVISGTPQWDYLVSRAVDEEDIHVYCRTDPAWPELVIFPIEEDGHLVGWQGRRIDGGTPKYTSSHGPDWETTAGLVWGLDRIYPGQPVFVCEGIFTALSVARYGPLSWLDKKYGQGTINSVAILGKELSQLRMKKILDRCPGSIIFVPDNDEVDEGHPAWPTDCHLYKWRPMVRSLDRHIRIGVCCPPKSFKDFGDVAEYCYKKGISRDNNLGWPYTTVRWLET